MAKKKRFVFLSQKFYNTYPTSKYPEMEQKQNRPYSIALKYVKNTVKSTDAEIIQEASENGKF